MVTVAVSPSSKSASIIENGSSTKMKAIPSSDIDSTFRFTTNLASSLLNTTILACSNDYFAAASNLLNPGPPIHRPGVFIHTGAWYDGWETRRHNPEPYDWVVIKLGAPGGGRLEGVEVDTAYFVGNYGEKAALQGFSALSATGSSEATPSDEEIASPEFQQWETILPPQQCGPSQRQAWKFSSVINGVGDNDDGDDDRGSYKVCTHVRLLMYPDGGFARLRLYGHAIPPPSPPSRILVSDSIVNGADEEELSSALVGSLALSASDQHYTPCSNLLLPGRGKDMGDGWETARSRAPGHVDWAIIRLGLPGQILRIVVDTKDFRGNFPRAVRVHGLAKSATEVVTSGFDANHDSQDDSQVQIQQDLDHDAESITVHSATEPTSISALNRGYDIGNDSNNNGCTINLGPDHPGWIPLLKTDMPCKADTEHVFMGSDLLSSTRDPEVGSSNGATGQGPTFTHVKLTLVPDGGVKRLRIFGKREAV